MLEVNKIYNMDCIDGMRMLDDCSIDLTVTSPPYDNLREYKGFSFSFEGTARQLYRVTKKGGVVVWVVGDATIDGSESGTSFMQALFFKSLGFNLHDTMIYFKQNPIQLNARRYEQMFEYMFVFSKGVPASVNLIKERSKNAGKINSGTMRNGGKDDLQLKHGAGMAIKEDKTIGNVWAYGLGGKGESNHPAVFPEALARDHILSWSNPGDLVLDPFMGSGTTAKMAKNHQRKYIGFEISAEYCKIATERCRQENVFDLLDRIQEDI